MKYFFAFQKKKAIPVPDGTSDNEVLAMQINHELLQYGFILNAVTISKLAKCDAITLDVIYNDLLEGIRTIVPGGGHKAIYENFPESVKALSNETMIRQALKSYYIEGDWSPEGAEVMHKTFAIEPVEYTTVSSLTDAEFDNIFYNIVYSNNSISAFDKSIVEWYLFNGYNINLSKIVFKETLAYVGQKLLDSDIQALPIQNATDVLRIWSAYSGGDEGLKANTKFINPSNKQRKMLLSTLDKCYNLEEAFKTDREKWLRVLFYLHPMDSKNKNMFPEVAKFANALRNEPKTLKTFNSKVEEAIASKDEGIFDLLKKRMGVFSRRLDHLIRVFDATAVSKWLSNSPNVKQMIDVYNHLHGRDKAQGGRSAVLAGQGSSEMVTYKDLKPLPAKVVKDSREAIKVALGTQMVGSLGKVFVDDVLYFRPLAMNNRAASLSISGKAIGTVEAVPAGNVVRAYCMWEDRSDIDLSGLIITNTNSVMKVGWNDRYNQSAVTYSGDNTGRYDKNAEFLDIDTVNLAPDVEWVILEARIYSGHNKFSGYKVPPTAGWMLRTKPGANESWLPQTAKHSIALCNEGRTAYLSAYHAPTRSIVYLDLAMGENAVSGPEDALKMRVFLNQFIPNANKDEICWDTINQGHVLNLLATEVVDKEEDADIVFDENTPQEEVAKYL